MGRPGGGWATAFLVGQLSKISRLLWLDLGVNRGALECTEGPPPTFRRQADLTSQRFFRLIRILGRGRIRQRDQAL